MILRPLLAQAGDGCPIIESPIPLTSVLRAPHPEPLPKPSHLHSMAAEPDSLEAQRWALVIPDDKRGERLRAILKPLCEFREEQQRAKVDIHLASPAMGATTAHEFREKVLHQRTRSPREHARYILLAGDPEALSLELQNELTRDGFSFVGRLALEREEDYEAYVSKVVTRERNATRSGKARALFLSVQDRTLAVQDGLEFIVNPTVRRCEEERKRGYAPASTMVREELPAGSAHRLLELVASTEPSLLFTLSHGIGGRHLGWTSVEDQRRHQGNMSLGDGAELTPEDISQRAFLPGGIWFYFACLGAGTPPRSVYQPWLEKLMQAGDATQEELKKLEQTRPVDARPFMAALPQAALANPQGPLAVIAHLDLAWICAFHNPRTGQSHSHHLESALTSLLEGHRAGVALNSLSRIAGQADAALLKQYQAEAEAKAAGQSNPVNPAEQASLWMERHDVSNYVLLGDPAVRLVDRPQR